MTATVSVILPVYNRPASLGDACRSVLDQSYRDLELIVVDDASTEDLAPVLSDIADPRLVYLRRDTNGGAAAARNTGLAAARGRLIAFQDSDDIWLPGKLARQVALLDSLPEEIGAVTGSKILYGIDRHEKRGPGRVVCEPSAGALLAIDQDQLRPTLYLNRISMQNTLFRRDCFPGDVWFDALAKANEDWDFVIRLLQHTKVHESPDPVVLSFVSEDSISRSNRKKITGLVRILKNNRAILERHPDARGRLLYALGRRLAKAGKPRLGRPFVLHGLRTASGGLAVHILRMLLARAGRQRA